MATNITQPPIQNTSQNILNNPVISAAANARLADTAEARPKPIGWLSNIINIANKIVSFGFDFFLLYTIVPTPGITPPIQVGWMIKFAVIVVSYIVINIVLSIIIYGGLIPGYYSTYNTNYSNFYEFLKKQYTAYQSNFSSRILEESGDYTTTYILAWYPVILDPAYNKAKNIEEYKDYITDQLLKNKDNPKDKPVYDYFISMPDRFQEYAANQESYVYKSIQYWILMLCIILFVIPIKYILVDLPPVTSVLPVPPVPPVPPVSRTNPPSISITSSATYPNPPPISPITIASYNNNNFFPSVTQQQSSTRKARPIFP